MRASEAAGFVEAVRAAILDAQSDVARSGLGASDDSVGSLKFAECVPAALLARLARARLAPLAEAAALTGWPLRVRIETASDPLSHVPSTEPASDDQ